MSDPGNYRTRAEIEKYQERDPIKLFAANLKEKDLLDDETLKQSKTAHARKSNTPHNSPSKALSPHRTNSFHTFTHQDLK
jgi:TPP-dependent pyruvate/acetoin dehydrogenase alpha subunit